MKNRTQRLLGALAFSVLSMPMFAQLSGSYTIDANGTGTSNYTTFGAATAALTTSGVSGAVTFNVASGTYTEQVTLTAVTGASSANTITFQGSTTAPSIITYSPAASATNWTVRLDGADYVTLDNLTITTGGSTYGRLVNYTDTVTDFNLTNCHLIGATGSSTSSNYGGLYYTYPAVAGGTWHIKDNVIDSVSYALYVYGSGYGAGSGADSVFIEDNTINATYYGFYTRYARYSKVHDNVVNSLVTNGVRNYVYYPVYELDVQGNQVNDGAYGIYVYSAPPTSGATGGIKATISNNHFEGNYYGIRLGGSGSATTEKFTDVTIENNTIEGWGSSYNYGIYLAYINASATNRAKVRNNMISLNTTSTTGTLYGIYPFHVANVDMHHNSIAANGGSLTNSRLIYLNHSTSTSYFTPGGNDLTNNIVANLNGGKCVIGQTATTGSAAYCTTSNNLFYTTNTTPHTNFTPATSDLTGDPMYVNPLTDLHIGQGQLSMDAGTPVGVTKDIDGDRRSTTTPDIGADEIVTCLIVSGLNATNVTDVSFDANWTSPNASNIGCEARVSLAGATSYTYSSDTSGTKASFTGLTAGTYYEYSVREICAIGDTANWSDAETVMTALCSVNTQCIYTFNMTDSYGDGWNGCIVGIEQQDPSGQWVLVGQAGAGFTSGYSASTTLTMCSEDSARIVCVNNGTYSSEVGFNLIDFKGDTISFKASGAGNFASGDLFATVWSECPNICPIDDAATLATTYLCGPQNLVLTGSDVNNFHNLLWLNSNQQVVHSGISHDLGVVDSTRNVLTVVYTDDTLMANHIGALSNLFGGYSNSDNGTWFTVENPLTIDSITVKSNGAVDFQVNISAAKGNSTTGNQGDLLQQSGVISLSAAGTHKVSVGMILLPGQYFMNMETSSNTTGILHRAVTGAVYPYAISNLISLDSVDFPNQTRAYFAYDWVVSQGCVGPLVTSQVVVEIGADTSVTASGPLDFCSYDDVTLTAAAGQTYLWSNGATTQSITVSQAGSYSAVVTTTNGCVDTTATYTTTVFADADTSVTASGPLDFCSYDDVTLTAAAGQSYAWSTGDTAQAITSTMAGTYSVIVTTSDGCTDTTVDYNTTIFADADTSVVVTQTLFCASDSAILIAAPGQTYLWNNGDTTQASIVNTTGDYFVTATTTNGCATTSDTTSITVVPDVIVPQIVSNGLGWAGTGSSTSLTITTDSTQTYQWNVEGGVISSGQGTDSLVVTWGIPDTSVTVWLVITNGVCTDSTSINIVISGIGFEDTDLANAKLYPNPNDGYFTVEVPEQYIGSELNVIDGVGRVVEHMVIQQMKTNIDLRRRPKGVYRIQIKSKQGIKTIPVVIQ